ncbi:hypothetical protein JTE90_005871 [Oedothorax gibbosus]|uniref:Protein kinase C-binding protein 1 n=1 Tax=Oedothorax gibbosus TaxID=931172 RepID=A0AAV6URZ9_9ARAC|nr:hypothetical protein JTE90_005871 [Oedothorax gibbosus]
MRQRTMLSQKRSLPAECSSLVQEKKRKDSHLLDTSENPRHDQGGNSSARVIDSYCWVCHQLGDEEACTHCPRVFHSQCLDETSLETLRDGTCPDCKQKTVDLQSQSPFLTTKTIQEILIVASTLFRERFKRSDKEIFFHWPNVGNDELIKILDFDLIEDNIKSEFKKYKTLSEVVSDLKWLHHNTCIVDGLAGSSAKEAEAFVRAFQKEISDIEDCPMCYYHMFVGKKSDNFFEKVCHPPHDIVWAWLKGSSPWPAKCLKVESGKAHVRFFGTHDKSNIPLGNKKCLAISLYHPTHKKSKITDENLIPKKKEYQWAVKELLRYIRNFEEKYRTKFTFSETGTPYKQDAVKPGRKKRKRGSRSNVSSCEILEENTLLESPSLTMTPSIISSESVLNESEVSDPVNPNAPTVINIEDREGEITENHIEVANLEHRQSLYNESSPSSIASCSTDVQIFYPQETNPSIPSTSNHQISTLAARRSRNRATYYNDYFRLAGSQAHANSARLSLDSPAEQDDDVICLGTTETSPNMNDRRILPYIRHFLPPDLLKQSQQVQGMIESLVMRSWANANNMPELPEVIAQLMSKTNEVVQQNRKLKIDAEQNCREEENKILRQKYTKLTQEFKSIKAELAAANEKNSRLEAELQEITSNAYVATRGMYPSFFKECTKQKEALSKTMNEELKRSKATLEKRTNELIKMQKALEKTKTQLQRTKKTVNKLLIDKQTLKDKLAKISARSDKMQIEELIEEKLIKLGIVKESPEDSGTKLQTVDPSTSKEFQPSISPQLQTAHLIPECSISSSLDYQPFQQLLNNPDKHVSNQSTSKEADTSSSLKSEASFLREIKPKDSVCPSSIVKSPSQSPNEQATDQSTSKTSSSSTSEAASDIEIEPKDTICPTSIDKSPPQSPNGEVKLIELNTNPSTSKERAGQSSVSAPFDESQLSFDQVVQETGTSTFRKPKGLSSSKSRVNRLRPTAHEGVASPVLHEKSPPKSSPILREESSPKLLHDQPVAGSSNYQKYKPRRSSNSQASPSRQTMHKRSNEQSSHQMLNYEVETLSIGETRINHQQVNIKHKLSTSTTVTMTSARNTIGPSRPSPSPYMNPPRPAPQRHAQSAQVIPNPYSRVAMEAARVHAFQASYSSYAHHIARRERYHMAANHSAHGQSRGIQHARSRGQRHPRGRRNNHPHSRDTDM